MSQNKYNANNEFYVYIRIKNPCERNRDLLKSLSSFLTQCPDYIVWHYV
jgi:hypothetical protein